MAFDLEVNKTLSTKFAGGKEGSLGAVTCWSQQTEMSLGTMSDKRSFGHRGAGRRMERKTNGVLPESGEPMTHATPWNSALSPNALVSF